MSTSSSSILLKRAAMLVRLSLSSLDSCSAKSISWTGRDRAAQRTRARASKMEGGAGEGGGKRERERERERERTITTDLKAHFKVWGLGSPFFFFFFFFFYFFYVPSALPTVSNTLLMWQRCDSWVHHELHFISASWCEETAQLQYLAELKWHVFSVYLGGWNH